MFSLFSACVGCTRDATAGRKKVTLVILGLDNSGKSTVSACLQNNSTEDVTPTLGFANGRARLRGCDVTLLDLGGSERIRDIWNNYYAESHGVIFVVDASDRERLVESKEILINVIRDSRIAGKPLLIYANKQDHEGAMTDMELFRFLDLEQVSQGSIDQCRVVSCSAIRSCQRGSKVDGRIKRGIRWLLSCVKGNWEYLSEKVTREYSAQVSSHTHTIDVKLHGLHSHTKG
jgi:ADP-ribosylation factor-like protein 13B